MIAPRRCNALSRSPFELAADWEAGAAPALPPSWPGGPDWSDGQVVLTQSARDGIRLAAQAGGLRAGDEVLVPAYTCGSEITPFVKLGAKVSMYRVTEQAEVDMDDLLSRVGTRTRVVYLTHYFGKPTAGRDLVDACHRRGLKVVEDCALSLFSAGVGHLGDATVFSLRKTLPVGDGGLLRLRGASIAEEAMSGPSLSIAAKGTGSLIKSWLRGFGPAPTLRVDHEDDAPTPAGSELPDLPAAYYRSAGGKPRLASRLARGCLRRIDPVDIRSRRRANYGALQELLGDPAAATPFWRGPLLDGVCPLGFPLLVDNKRLWWQVFNAAGIPISPWWEGCHRGLDWPSFPEALALKSRLILLPVHQGLTTRDMDYVAHVARTLARRPGRGIGSRKLYDGKEKARPSHA